MGGSCPAGTSPAGPPIRQPTRRPLMSSATTDISEDRSGLVARLSLEQKVRLLTGADAWVLHGAGSIGLRPMVFSDGPAGVRGPRFDSTDPSHSLPCPVGLAPPW